MEYANRLAELRGDMSQDEFARLIGLKQQNCKKPLKAVHQALIEFFVWRIDFAC